MALSSCVRIVAVGPRDGLQNEATLLPVAVKIELIERLASAGPPVIEVARFMSAKRVPRTGDTAQAFAGLRRKPRVVSSALAPNERGIAAARATKADDLAIFTTASHAFCRNNINCSVDNSLERFAPVAEAARACGVKLRGYVSCARALRSGRGRARRGGARRRGAARHRLPMKSPSPTPSASARR